MYSGKNDNKLVNAINANNWDQIFLEAILLDSGFLLKISGLFKSKIDPICYLNPERILSDTVERDNSKCRNWIVSNKERIINNYMYSFLFYWTYNSDKKVDFMINNFEKLVIDFPERHETFLSLSFVHAGIKGKSLYYLNEAIKTAPTQESVLMWTILRNPDDISLQMASCQKGYELNKNILFLYVKARILKKVGNTIEAKQICDLIYKCEPSNTLIYERTKQLYSTSNSPIIGFLLLGLVGMVVFAIIALILGTKISESAFIIFTGAGFLVGLVFPLIIGTLSSIFRG